MLQFGRTIEIVLSQPPLCDGASGDKRLVVRAMNH